MTASLADDMTQAAMRLAVNYPSLSFRPGGRSYGFAESVLSGINDGKLDVDNQAPNLSIGTAIGSGLGALGRNYGQDRYLGNAAGVQVQFSLQQPATSTQQVGAGTGLSTQGDVSTPAVGFTTQATATISTGQTLAGATIGPVTPVTGTTVSAGLAGHVNPSLTQPNLTAATWKFQATASGAYTLFTTPQGGTQTTVATGLTTGTVYDDVAHIPGVAFSITGALTIGDSATILTGGATVLAVQNSPTDPDTNGIFGTQGNVGVGKVNSVTTPLLGGVQVTNPLAVDGTNGSVLGTDPWSDAQYRQNLNTLLYPKYSSAQGQSAIIAVPTVFDALIVDPQNGTGAITYYWCDATGAQPGLTYPAGVATIAAGSTAALVDAALRAVLPSGVAATPAAFTVTNLTGAGSIAATYSADASAQTATLNPQIQAALSAYVQSLTHAKTPTVYGMIQALNTAGIVLSNFSLTTSFAAAGSTAIYRSTGTPATVVALTRV
ncbi:MAG: hypothetical protein JWO59_750 [Chloroflexi bacterium]|nr:hypothetical protein [Chloroflexota bacterium]